MDRDTGLTLGQNCDTLQASDRGHNPVSSRKGQDTMTEATTTESGVEIETFDGEISTAYGKTLDTPLRYLAEYEKLLSYDAIPPKELPDKNEILKSVNDARKANARQKAIQNALDLAKIEKPTIKTSPELRFRNIVDSVMASGKTREQAEQIARMALE